MLETSAIKGALKDVFLRHNLIVFSGSIATALLNYAFSLVMGRLMTVQDYGAVQALFSLLTSFTVLATAFRFSTVNLVACGDETARSQTLPMTQRLVVGIALVAAVALASLSGQLRDWLHFDSRWPFVGLAAILLISFLANFRQALAHGRNDFATVAKGGLMTSAAKLAFSVLLVVLGMHIMGPVIGLFIGSVLSLVYLNFKTWQTLKPVAFRTCRLDRSLGREMRYVLLVLAVNLCLTLLYTLDTIVAKRYFSATEAGLYGGIATVGRIIVFGTASVSAVVLSSVRPGGGLANAVILRKALALAGGLGSAVMVVFLLLPQFVVRLLMGSRFLPFAGLLPRVALISLLAAIASPILFYHMALRRYALFWVAAGAVAVMSVLSLTHHGSAKAVADNFIYAGTFIILALAPLTVIEAVRGTRIFAYVQNHFHRRPGA